LGGNETVTDTFPLVHGTVTGKPTTAPLDDRVQVWARITVAEIVTVPPLAGRFGGLATNEVRSGRCVGETVTLCALDVLLDEPWAVNVK
jgi:hypothetical protein